MNMAEFNGPEADLPSGAEVKDKIAPITTMHLFGNAMGVLAPYRHSINECSCRLI